MRGTGANSIGGPTGGSRDTVADLAKKFRYDTAIYFRIVVCL